MTYIPETFSPRKDDRGLGEAALHYAALGWPVFPCRDKHQPLTTHGFKDATTNPTQIAEWWRRWPRAWIGVATGHAFAVLDIDLHEDCNGFQTVKALGVEKLPVTPTVKTPSGGYHLYFEQTEPPIGVTVGALGRGIGLGLDWRGLGGYVILPPSGEYRWIMRAAALAPVPLFLLPKERKAAPAVRGTPMRCDVIGDYGIAAVRSAVENILDAPRGQQRITLRNEAYAIGTLAGAGGVPVKWAYKRLLRAANKLKSYNKRSPWKPGQAADNVRDRFRDGLCNPRPSMADNQRAADDELAPVHAAAVEGN
jgi:bifunctional DNA primase/polymerase-like protein